MISKRPNNFLDILQEIITFDESGLKARGYRINDRKFKDIREITGMSADYRGLFFPYGDECIVYSGAEHNPEKLSEKLPNITFLPNYDWQNSRQTFVPVMGSTLGHQHTAKFGDTRPFQEIYEFLGYGAMVLRNPDEITLNVLKPGEKVIVGTRDNMMFLNLQDEPLVTIDYANPTMNSANKDLEKKIGPIMMVEQPLMGQILQKHRTKIRLNSSYMANGILNVSELADQIIEIYTPLGKELYDKLSSDPDYKTKFARSGITLSFGGNVPTHFKKEFTPSLLELVLTQNKALFDALRMPRRLGG